MGEVVRGGVDAEVTDTGEDCCCYGRVSLHEAQTEDRKACEVVGKEVWNL